MGKKFFIINIILLILILISDIAYMVLGGLWLKTITSSIFVIIGLINLIFSVLNKTENKRFPIFLFIGLVFAMAGDIVLNLIFIYGAIMFAIGHIFYFVAYCNLVKFNLKDLLYSACIFIPSTLLITLAPFFNFGGLLMEIVCIIYALIISIIVGKAISLVIVEKNILNLILVVGSVLFFISDFMLLLNVFAGASKWAGIICLATYYPAQFFLAYSIYTASNNHIAWDNK